MNEEQVLAVQVCLLSASLNIAGLYLPKITSCPTLICSWSCVCLQLSWVRKRLLLTVWLLKCSLQIDQKQTQSKDVNQMTDRRSKAMTTQCKQTTLMFTLNVTHQNTLCESMPFLSHKHFQAWFLCVCRSVLNPAFTSIFTRLLSSSSRPLLRQHCVSWCITTIGTVFTGQHTMIQPCHGSSLKIIVNNTLVYTELSHSLSPTFVMHLFHTALPAYCALSCCHGNKHTSCIQQTSPRSNYASTLALLYTRAGSGANSFPSCICNESRL